MREDSNVDHYHRCARSARGEAFWCDVRGRREGAKGACAAGRSPRRLCNGSSSGLGRGEEAPSEETAEEKAKKALAKEAQQKDNEEEEDAQAVKFAGEDSKGLDAKACETQQYRLQGVPETCKSVFAATGKIGENLGPRDLVSDAGLSSSSDSSSSMAGRSLAVFGFGNVGRVLCEQALAVGCAVPVVADSSAAIVKSSGLTSDDLRTLGEAKAGGVKLAEAAASVADARVSTPKEAVAFMAKLPGKPGVADTSANANAAEDYLLDALKLKLPISLANKKPLSEDLAAFRALTADPSLIGYEATVGAGLPVICTLQRMIDSGDEVTRAEGQLSGTLGYILSALQQGGKFSDIVREAKAQGFTEPDPRDDLSGTDVARKALILARTMGEDISMDQLTVEALYPSSFADLPLDEFMDRLPELDDEIDAKVRKASEANEMLRYAAVVEPGKPISVGLVQVKSDAPLASLQGTDNLVSFSSKWYNNSPTVVRGPGAGLEVTAAGVLADFLFLTRK